MRSLHDVIMYSHLFELVERRPLITGLLRITIQVLNDILFWRQNNSLRIDLVCCWNHRNVNDVDSIRWIIFQVSCYMLSDFIKDIGT